MYMKHKEPIPEISPLVRQWMPDATEEELKEGTVEVRRFLAVMYRVFRRLEAEGKLAVLRDNSARYDTVDAQHKKL